MNFAVGDTVVLRTFTGMPISAVKVKISTERGIVIEKRDGSIAIFDPKTKKQIDPIPKAPKYASYLTDDADTTKIKQLSEHKPKKIRIPKKEEQINRDEYIDPL